MRRVEVGRIERHDCPCDDELLPDTSGLVHTDSPAAYLPWRTTLTQRRVERVPRRRVKKCGSVAEICRGGFGGKFSRRILGLQAFVDGHSFGSQGAQLNAQGLLNLELCGREW